MPTRPVQGGSSGTWGTELNAWLDAAAADEFVKSGVWLEHPGQTGFSNGTLTQSMLVGTPFCNRALNDVSFQAISVVVTTAVAATTVRLGWYAVGTNGLPGARLYDLGTVDASTTGVKTISSTFVLPPGWSYFASCAQGGAPGMRSLDVSEVGESQMVLVTTNGLSASPQTAQPYLSSVTGALPNPFGTPTGFTTSLALTNGVPRFSVQVT